MSDPVCCVCGKEATYSEVLFLCSKYAMRDMQATKVVPEEFRTIDHESGLHLCTEHEILWNTPELDKLLHDPHYK